MVREIVLTIRFDDEHEENELRETARLIMDDLITSYNICLIGFHCRSNEGYL